jgi:hypothetical protein
MNKYHESEQVTKINHCIKKEEKYPLSPEKLLGSLQNF